MFHQNRAGILGNPGTAHAAVDLRVILCPLRVPGGPGGFLGGSWPGFFCSRDCRGLTPHLHLHLRRWEGQRGTCWGLGEGRSTGNSAWLELPVGALIPTPSCQASPPGLANAPSTSGSALQHLWDEREGEDGSDMEQLWAQGRVLAMSGCRDLQQLIAKSKLETCLHPSPEFPFSGSPFQWRISLLTGRELGWLSPCPHGSEGLWNPAQAWVFGWEPPLLQKSLCLNHIQGFQDKWVSAVSAVPPPTAELWGAHVEISAGILALHWIRLQTIHFMLEAVWNNLVKRGCSEMLRASSIWGTKPQVKYLFCSPKAAHQEVTLLLLYRKSLN